jgi:hypothetical protein
MGAVAVAQAFGTDSSPIGVPRPKRAVNAGRSAGAGFVKSDHNAASLLRAFRCLIAESDGAHSELSLDSGGVTDESDA